MTNNKLKIKRHEERPDLTGEHPFGDLGQLIFLIIFLIVWIADIFFIKLSESQYIDLPLWIQIPVGSIILILGFYLAKKSMKMVFGTKRDKPEIINNKIYDKVRHPMYLGALLFYLGITVLMLSLPLFITFIATFIFYNFIARHEEKLLLNQFGDDYANYMKRVSRWIPRL
ncbi:MAG: isoprenylcysteine carboxylmethyltransferase family protein [Bacteroidales bacterium]|nr:isoprenylcysteine carboxylmethyltransferase family protein [Bacteroidales bacterium]